MVESKVRKAIVLGGGYDQLPLFPLLRAKGIRSVLVDYLDEPPGAALADEHVQKSTWDLEAVIATAREKGAEMVLSSGNDAVVTVIAQTAEALGIRGCFSVDTAMAATNKLAMKDRFGKHGIPTSNWKIVERDQLGAELVVPLKYPLVAKPVKGSGSKGVVRIEGPDGMAAALKQLFEENTCDQAVVEEFIQGTEITVDCFVLEGKATVLTKSWLVQAPTQNGGFAFHRMLSPAPISDVVDQQLPDIAGSIARAFGIEEGPFFFQAIASHATLHILELGVRPAGGWKHKFVEAATGFDPLAAYVDLLSGEKPQLPAEGPLTFLSMNHIYARAGTLGAIENAQMLIDNGSVAYFLFPKGPGTVLTGGVSTRDRVASFLVKAATLQELESRVAMVVDQLEVRDVNGRALMRKEPYEHPIIFPAT
jgi:biotin carboxylase